MRPGEGKPVRAWRFHALIAAAALGVLGCFALIYRADSDTSTLEQQAERFVSLALSLGNQRPMEVDAYFGPRDLDVRGKTNGPKLTELLRESQELLTHMESGDGGALSARLARLQRQIRSLSELVEVLDRPGARTFDEEARRVYGMELLAAENAGSGRDLRRLDELLPGTGSLAFRVATFRNQFIVPADRRKAVFERALSECRARTIARWSLPAAERLEVVWTRDVDAAWHRYEGNGRSTLQLNPAAVAFVGSAIDVACHEGYPGHHAQFVVMEADAGLGGLAVEDTVVLLRSPVSMLREGAATYGVELVFPPEERLTFEREVLFPLAGLDPAKATTYAEVHRLVDALSVNVVPILREYRDKRLLPELASRELESSALVSSPESLLRFVGELGPYVLGYTIARDRVRNSIDARRRQSGDDPWTILRRSLAQADVSLLSQADPALAMNPVGTVERR